jgi:hypothetical protein
MIVEVLARVALADAVAGALLALAIYFIGNRPDRRVTRGQAVALAILFGLPATLLLFIAWCFARLSE